LVFWTKKNLATLPSIVMHSQLEIKIIFFRCAAKKASNAKLGVSAPKISDARKNSRLPRCSVLLMAGRGFSDLESAFHVCRPRLSRTGADRGLKISAKSRLDSISIESRLSRVF
jgi:hypothetical protein